MRRQKVQVWIYYLGTLTSPIQFLILKMLPERGGAWQPVTGSVEEGESLEEAAIREAKEETGLLFQSPPSRVGEPFEFESQWSQKVIEYGYGLAASSQNVQLDPREHTEYRWVSAAEAIQTVGYPSNAQVLKSLLKELVQD